MKYIIVYIRKEQDCSQNIELIKMNITHDFENYFRCWKFLTVEKSDRSTIDFCYDIARFYATRNGWNEAYLLQCQLSIWLRM